LLQEFHIAFTITRKFIGKVLFLNYSKKVTEKQVKNNTKQQKNRKNRKTM
jgi:hypothetical protein